MKLLMLLNAWSQWIFSWCVCTLDCLTLKVRNDWLEAKRGQHARRSGASVICLTAYCTLHMLLWITPSSALLERAKQIWVGGLLAVVLSSNTTVVPDRLSSLKWHELTEVQKGHCWMVPLVLIFLQQRTSSPTFSETDADFTEKTVP